MKRRQRDKPDDPPAPTGAKLVLSALTVLLSVGCTSQILQGQNPVANSETLGLLAFSSFGVVGATILFRQPGHPLGRLWSAIGLAALLAYSSDQYAALGLRGHADVPGSLFAGWLQHWVWFVPIPPVFTHTPLLFPDGRPSGKGGRILLWLATIALALITASFAFTRGELDGFEPIDNPAGILPDDALDPVIVGSLITLVVVAVLAVVSLVLRYRRSRGERRQQIKFMAFAAGVVLAVILNLSLNPLVGVVPEAATDLIFGACLLFFPVACGVAILRYRLYDIDVIINRTLVYLVLSVTLALTYFACIILLQQVLPLTRQSDLAVAASTLAVAALFRPARARIQRFIDRRFYRSRYDAAATLTAFGTKLRDELHIDMLAAEINDVVTRTLQPAHVSVWIRPLEEEGAR